MTPPDKIESDLNINFPSWVEFVEDLNSEMCCTKLSYSDNKPLFYSDLKVNDDLSDSIPRGNKHIFIYHQLQSDFNKVGLQLWNASIIMADWIVNTKESLKNLHVLELGCGVGFLSILISFYSKVVYATDFNIDVLKLCNFNLINNKISNSKVKVLDWNYNINENFSTIKTKESEFYLNCKDENTLQGKIDLIIASDVIYDDDLSDAFMRTIHDLLLINSESKVIIFVQKRIICSYLNEECAPHFEHFLDLIDQLNGYVDEKENIQFLVENINIDKLDQYFQYESKPSHVHGFQISTYRKS